MDCAFNEEEDLEKGFNFVKQLAECWSKEPKNSIGDLVIYGGRAATIPLHSLAHLRELITSQESSESTCRRMDLALTEAANNFSTSPTEHRVVVLITAGRQVSTAENKEGDHELLTTASELLSSRNIKTIIVSVGLETDFRELGLLVQRPQYFFPLSGFDDMTPDTAQNIVSNIVKTLGEVIIILFSVAYEIVKMNL